MVPSVVPDQGPPVPQDTPDNPPDPEMILASSSPRRRDLLTQAGLAFEVVPPALPEPGQAVAHRPPRQQAEALAYFKAADVAKARPGRLVLGADTLVAVGGEVLGKPIDAQHARQMLRRLSGQAQEVITGVAMVDNQGRRLIASDVTHLVMRDITDDEIEAYIASGEWVGKAGAYAIQETGDRFITQVQGSLSNVVGLPVELVKDMLARFAPSRPQGPEVVR